MKIRTISTIAAAAFAIAATSAQAAADLTGVTVRGSNGQTIWTTTQTGNYAVFVQQPLGNVLNPNNESISDPTEDGLNSFSISGEGFYPGAVGDSDPSYVLTLAFADGAVISGTYDKLFTTPLNVVNAVVDGTAYTFGGFSWNRTLSDNVSPFRAVSGGDKSDYAGQFSFTASAVPEPTTWGMMVLGFGLVGFGMRARRNAAATATA